MNQVLQIPAEKVVIGRDIRFDESQLFKDLIIRISRPLNEHKVKIPPGSINEEDDSEIVDDNLRPINDISSGEPRRSGRTVRSPTYLNDYEVSMNICEALLCDSIGAESDDIWKDAKLAELESMKKHNVWTLVPKRKDMKVIKSRWILHIKENGKRKARLVAAGWDWSGAEESVYAPVANTITIRAFLVNAVQKGMHIDQMDIKNAFLHGEIKDEVYISQPPGFIKDKNQVCQLNKALYGLNISPKIFNECFDQYARSVLMFERSETHRCLYTKLVNGKVVHLLIYVDDILITSEDQNLINSVKCSLQKKFDMVDLDKVKTFLGVNIEYDIAKGIMFLHQPNFIQKIINRFGMQESYPVFTPIEHKLQLQKEEISVPENLPYRQLIGSLLYVNISTRPDISYAVNFLSQFQNCFSKTHFEHVKRIVHYLKGTIHLKLKISKADNPQAQPLQCYVDANWANDVNDRHSISGYCILYFDNPIAWCTRKQPTVTVSSTDAELVAVSNLINDHLLWVIQVIRDNFDIKNCMPVPIYEDNQGTIAILNDTKVTGRSKRKHIDTRFRFIKEGIKAKEFEIVYVPTQSQIADIFTKGLSRPCFERFRSNLGLTF